MGSADVDELLKAAALLAEQDCVALLGSETGKLVAAVGQSGLAKAAKRAASSAPRPRPWAEAAEAGLSWRRAEGPMQRSWTRPWRRERGR